jgi:hypothetical protein
MYLEDSDNQAWSSNIYTLHNSVTNAETSVYTRAQKKQRYPNLDIARSAPSVEDIAVNRGVDLTIQRGR